LEQPFFRFPIVRFPMSDREMSHIGHRIIAYLLFYNLFRYNFAIGGLYSDEIDAGREVMN
jgi:hypothetical protein